LTPDVKEKIRRTGTHHDDGFQKALAARGWMAPGWPVELGGQGQDPLDLLAFNEELELAGAPMYGPQTTLMVANAVAQFGTEQQKADIIEPSLRGAVVFVLGFSEPGCGSDVAAAKTRAEREGDEWIINGAKMFTTNAHVGDCVLLLARTDPNRPKHQGLTMFVVPLDSPGIEIRPIYTLSGERTNLTFYTDVRVPDSLRIGGVNDGWRVLTFSLAEERSGAFGGESERLLQRMEAWAETGDAAGRPHHESPDVRERLGRAATENEVIRLLSWRNAWMSARGRLPGVEGSMAKLFSSEAITRQGADLVDMLGPDGIRLQGDPDAPADGEAEWALRYALGTTTYGGTSEIQRGIIAERGLGLPRSR
jgi:alkylation response protein AidB-like acyl-CoA dehydrogenase